jgi:predicted transcriptional regulator YdeE
LKIDKSEPRIVRLNAPIKMIGVSMRTGMHSIYKDAPFLGKQYSKITASISNKQEPWAFVAISTNFSNDKQNWDYSMGDVVTSFEYVPEGLTTFEIPPGTYAVFAVRPRFNFLWGMMIGKTKNYVFNQWLPNSKYAADNEVLGDFEYHDERSVGRHPSIDLYVPVKEKGK